MPIRSTCLQLAIFLALLCALPAPAQSQTYHHAERLAELEQDNQRLRRELANLRLELAQLRRVMAERQEHETPEARETGGDHSTDQQPISDSESSDDEDQRETFGSGDEIFRSIPQNHRPGREGWDLPQRLAVEEWLVANIPGNKFDARLEIHHVAIGYNSIREEWNVTLHFAKREIRYMGWGVEQRVQRISLYGDRAFADRARRLEEGARVRVTGAIASTNWGIVIGQVADEEWKPEYYEIRLEETDVESPHLRR